MNGGSSTSNVKSYAVLQVIWLAMLISVATYVAVAYIYVNSSQYSVTQVPERTMFAALAAVSLFLFLLQVFFRSFLSDNRLFPKILKKMRAGHGDPAGTPDPANAVLLENHFTYSIVLWALGEVPAIFGLVLTFLSGDIRYVAGFALYSVLNMFVFRPSRSNFDNQLGGLRRYIAARG